VTNDPLAAFEREYHLSGKINVISQQVNDKDIHGNATQYTSESMIISPDTSSTEYSRFMNQFLDELNFKRDGIEMVAMVASGIHKPCRVLLAGSCKRWQHGNHFMVMTVDIEKRLRSMVGKRIDFTIQPKRLEDTFSV
jgi:hypothetical protein